MAVFNGYAGMLQYAWAQLEAHELDVVGHCQVTTNKAQQPGRGGRPNKHKDTVKRGVCVGAGCGYAGLHQCSGKRQYT